MTTAPLGLRDRKRIETRARIEQAAVALVLRDGLDATTIDAISARADISPRTFFNYFDSKDSAVLGVHEGDGDDLVGEVEPGTDLAPGVVQLLMNVMGASLESRGTIREDRLELIRRHPQVLGSQLAQLNARAERLTTAIENLMHEDTGAPPGEHRARAELLLALGGAAVRAAVREWAAEGSALPVDTIHQRAVALIKETAGQIS